MPLLCEQVENLLDKYAVPPPVSQKSIKCQDINDVVHIKHEQVDIDDNDNEFKIDLDKEINETGILY